MPKVINNEPCEKFVASKLNFLLPFLDSCFSLFIVSPLVVCFWRGIWCIINEYHDRYQIFPVCPFLIACYLTNTTIYYFRGKFLEFFMKKDAKGIKRFIPKFLVFRFHHYIFAFSCVMIWRCIWILPEEFIGSELGKFLKKCYTTQVFI